VQGDRRKSVRARGSESRDVQPGAGLLSSRRDETFSDLSSSACAEVGWSPIRRKTATIRLDSGAVKWTFDVFKAMASGQRAERRAPRQSPTSGCRAGNISTETVATLMEASGRSGGLFLLDAGGRTQGNRLHRHATRTT